MIYTLEELEAAENWERIAIYDRHPQLSRKFEEDGWKLYESGIKDRKMVSERIYNKPIEEFFIIPNDEQNPSKYFIYVRHK